MSWRTVVISNSAKLDYQMGFMVVRKSETIKIYLSEIELLIIESTAVSLTAALLNELTKQKVKVIFCDEKRNPSSELVSYYGSHDTSAKIRTQITWDEVIKKSVWTEIVTEKIRNQAGFLKKLNLDAAELLLHYVDEMGFNDETNREGHAAKVYFNALFGMDFTRTADNSINAALNYGYSLLLSSFNRCITANGYMTQVGLFHDNMFNPFNLASDLMEPFRIIVDRKVYEMKIKKFEIDEKHSIINILNEEVIIAGRNEILDNAIKIYVKSVFDAINSKDVSLLKFYCYEL